MLPLTKIKLLKDKYFHPKGFTLLELVVVIAILGILLSIGFVFYQRALANARDQQRITDLSNVKIALEQYFADDNFDYPPHIGLGFIFCDGMTLGWGTSPLTCNGTTYMKVLPQDPTGHEYCYIRPAPGTFDLYANMENSNNANMSSAAFCGREMNYIVESEE